MKTNFLRTYLNYLKYAILSCGWTVLFIYVPYLLTNKYEKLLLTILYLITFIFIVVPITALGIESYVSKEVDDENNK